MSIILLMITTALPFLKGLFGTSNRLRRPLGKLSDPSHTPNNTTEGMLKKVDLVQKTVRIHLIKAATCVESGTGQRSVRFCIVPPLYDRNDFQIEKAGVTSVRPWAITCDEELITAAISEVCRSKEGLAMYANIYAAGWKRRTYRGFASMFRNIYARLSDDE